MSNKIYLTEHSITEALQTQVSNISTVANNANTVANTAKNNAATAQNTANTAKTNAATAQTTANNAKTAADNAASAASTAQSTANSAETNSQWRYNDAVAKINNKMNSDNPTGTGTFSIDRKGSTVAENSFSFHGYANYPDAISMLGSASGDGSISIGKSSSAGKYAVAIGANAKANPSYNTTSYYCVAIGCQTHATGGNSIAVGNYLTLESGYDIAIGSNLKSSQIGSVVVGMYNDYNNSIGSFVVGNGSNSGSLSNSFRVTNTGVYAKGNYNASGADYAEMFEWADGNPNNEDRVGRFVTLDGENISFAENDNVFILGIVSAAPSICGDTASEDWQGRIERDIFGRMLFEDVEIPAEIAERVDEETGETVTEVVSEAHTMNWYKQNPDWDNEQEYTPRENRPEWDPVGLLGKLVMIDDGTAEINGYVKPSIGGIATKSNHETKFRVMKRIDENHIRVLIL